MRISQRSMYMDHLNHMQNTLSAYMESNMKGASQKQINRPADDPAGMARILMYRSSLSDVSQYQRNLDTAYGWLSAADQKLTLGDGGVTSLLSLIKTEAENGATGTKTAENRQQIADTVRGYFGNLMILTNSRYEGKSIFCGQNYNGSAFEMALAADCYDSDFQDSLNTALQGNPPDWIRFSNNAMESTALVRFTTSGVAGTNNIDYEYTLDGGLTWSTGTMTAASREVDLNGTIMTIPDGVQIPAFDEDNTTETQIWVRPTAMYQGSDNNMPPQIVRRGVDATIEVSTTGTLSTDIQIRIDSDIIDLSAANEDFLYSYSNDGGRTWVQKRGNTADPRLVVPGGFVVLSDTGSTAIAAGSELTVKPQRTNLDMQADQDYFATANHVGKDIFGGQYMSLTADGQPVLLSAFDSGPKSAFDTIGKLIGYLETNNQNGIQQCLADLDATMKHVTTYSANVSGRLSALEVARESLITDKDTQTAAMSALEDIDLTELLTKLTQQQLAYQTVLKSSSMIMQLNLTQFI